jgi:hypothetical protein
MHSHWFQLDHGVPRTARTAARLQCRGHRHNTIDTTTARGTLTHTPWHCVGVYSNIFNLAIFSLDFLVARGRAVEGSGLLLRPTAELPG